MTSPAANVSDMTTTPLRDKHTAGLSTSVLIAIVVTVLAWASAFIVIRGVAPHFGGGSLALARLAVGSVALSLVMIGHRWVKPTSREWLLILIFGVAWFGAYNVTLNIAEHTLDAGTTAMIINIGPILIALGAGAFLGEGIPKWLAIGAGIAFVGVVLIGIGTGIAAGASSNRFGDGSGIVWALVAAVAYAIGVLCQKPALKRLPARQVTFMGCVIGMIACLPFLGELIGDLRTAPIASILGAVYLGVVPTALAFSTWAYALSKMPAGQLGVTTYVVPAVAIVLGLIFFAEVPAPVAIVGGAICLVGVGVSRKRVVARP
ncbi:MAG: hypothetical protein QOI70_9 [Microbacteriaceae bacterium]|nr:hypothetical protein [Microbacteriaceae bacterium]